MRGLGVYNSETRLFVRKQQWRLLKRLALDAAVASIISELESISSLKEEQRMALKAFLEGKYVFALLLCHTVA